MKRVKELDIFKRIREIREFEFGVFYFFKGGIIISEINEGVLFKWENAEKVMSAAQDIFGMEIPIIYIANRINSYYVVPSSWVMFYKNRNELAYCAGVGQTKGSFASVVLERIFFKNFIAHFQDLDDALLWALDKSNAINQPTEE
ncbi:hypothetical protein [Maribacter sp. ACAM166]|uniref:hypothetical protein n=1 Tax=Maribacter sp. ACAM166 TaxID=2508996 RepID=UPI0010FD954B|nr:hypothetical protein [Maribacter sp. ACAM166]TLP77301.1 hypothetical protein ES765_12720 [Maribacter sp. ACAM166]